MNWLSNVKDFLAQGKIIWALFALTAVTSGIAWREYRAVTADDGRQINPQMMTAGLSAQEKNYDLEILRQPEKLELARRYFYADDALLCCYPLLFAACWWRVAAPLREPGRPGWQRGLGWLFNLIGWLSLQAVVADATGC
jgi:hypothetical protein